MKTDCVSATGAVRTLSVVPRRQSLTVGDSLQPLAVATSLRTMESSDVTGQVTWESSNPAVATTPAPPSKSYNRDVFRGWVRSPSPFISLTKARGTRSA